MRKIGIIVLGVALAAFVGSTVYAGCGSCGPKAEKSGCSAKCLKGLELSADQEAAVKKLTSACSEIGCDKTSKKKMMAGLKKILSEDQMATLKASCEKNGCTKGEAAPTAQLQNLDNQFACGGGCGGGDKKGDDEKTDA